MGRPGAEFLAPHAPPLRGSLPPEGVDPPWGGPALNSSPPTLRRCAGRCPPEGVDPPWGGPAADR
ncbi:MAG: hypothetical protein C0443_12505 [Comamonadaceae bacterium]|nr:hypothetical protein [Comamonadaceae bacterium]